MLYFDWLTSLVASDRQADDYTCLLTELFYTEFTWTIDMDENRAVDGIALRTRFEQETDCRCDWTEFEHPCTILEMMVALAVRCEEHIMDDFECGDRTDEWFWAMISNLGLITYTDDRFNEHRVKTIIQRFLNREYAKNGRGGLFLVHDMRWGDMRDAEIWYQMNWYLDEL